MLYLVGSASPRRRGGGFVFTLRSFPFEHADSRNFGAPNDDLHFGWLAICGRAFIINKETSILVHVYIHIAYVWQFLHTETRFAGL